MARIDLLGNLFEHQPLTQKRSERFHIENASNDGWPCAMKHPLPNPAKSAAQQAAHPHPIYVFDGQTGPCFFESADRRAKRARMGRETDRVDRPGRHAGVNQNVEFRPPLGDGAEHAYLVRGAGAAPG